MNKLLLIAPLIFVMSSAFSQNVYTHSIEGERQLDFPKVEIAGSEKLPLTYYSLKLEPEEKANGEKIRYEEKIVLPAGSTAKLSSYIIAKEMLESIKIKSMGNKTTEEEIRAVLNSNDALKKSTFFLKLAEKWRTSETEKESEEIAKKIKAKKTNDSPDSTPHFPTGFIEVLPESETSFKGKEDVRFFIPLAEIKNLTITPNSEIKFKKAVGLLAFKRLRGELSFPDLEESSVAAIDKLESSLSSPCTDNCILEKNFPKLGDFTVNVFKASIKAAKNEKMLVGEDQNKVILKALEDLIKSVFGACPSFQNISLN